DYFVRGGGGVAQPASQQVFPRQQVEIEISPEWKRELQEQEDRRLLGKGWGTNQKRFHFPEGDMIETVPELRVSRFVDFVRVLGPEIDKMLTPDRDFDYESLYSVYAMEDYALTAEECHIPDVHHISPHAHISIRRSSRHKSKTSTKTTAKPRHPIETMQMTYLRAAVAVALAHFDKVPFWEMTEKEKLRRDFILQQEEMREVYTSTTGDAEDAATRAKIMTEEWKAALVEEVLNLIKMTYDAFSLKQVAPPTPLMMNAGKTWNFATCFTQG
ncbi:unnamed protein product, partial [Amoebophrya sp. A25]